MKYSANGNFINNNPIIEHWSTEGTLYTENGNVGILTNNPQARLDVNGDIKSSGNFYIKKRNANLVIDGIDYDPIIRLKDSNNSGWTIRNSIPNNNLFSIGKDDNKHILNIKNNGKIGINEKNPSYLLDINHSEPKPLVNINNTNDNGSGLKIQAKVKPLQIVSHGDPEQKYFTIRGNGNIGIGTENPGHPLEINTFVDNNIMRINNTSEKGSGLVIGADNYPLRIGGKNNLSGEYLTIRGDGNVGIGNKNPQKKLVVNGTVQADKFITKDGTIIGGKQDFVLEGSKICLNNGETGSKFEKICLGFNDLKFITNIKNLTQKSLEDNNNNWNWMDHKE